jgi:hypothetical protein
VTLAVAMAGVTGAPGETGVASDGRGVGIVTGGADTTIAGVGVAAPGVPLLSVAMDVPRTGEDWITSGVGVSMVTGAVDSTAVVAVP